MLLVGDKIECKLEMGGVIKVGEVCEVTGIDNNCIEFKFRELHKGVMSYDEFEKYFNKYEKQKTVWTKWVKRQVYPSNVLFEYRTNWRTVQVRIKKDGKVYKGSCTCHKDDVFDIDKGIELAYARAELEKILDKLSNLSEEM